MPLIHLHVRKGEEWPRDTAETSQLEQNKDEKGIWEAGWTPDSFAKTFFPV